MHVLLTSFFKNIHCSNVLRFDHKLEINRPFLRVWISEHIVFCAHWSGSVVDRKRTRSPLILTDDNFSEVTYVTYVILLSHSKGLGGGESTQKKAVNTTSLILLCLCSFWWRSLIAMKKLKYRSYHVRIFQELKKPDKEKRLVYSRWFQSLVSVCICSWWYSIDKYFGLAMANKEMERYK